MKDLKTVTSAPTKDQAERMCKIAYYIDKKFLRATDTVTMGIDIYRLKEFGEVRMSKSQKELKKFTSELWGRMTDPMKAMFLWSYLCEEVDVIKELLNDFYPMVKNIGSERHHLDAILGSMSSKLPVELQAEIKKGFGREWRMEEESGLGESDGSKRGFAAGDGTG
jgi:hypothetical protein